MEAVAEVAGVKVLQDDPRCQGDRNREHAQQACQHRGTSDQGVRNRHEADEAARLRDRDRVCEVRKDERDERQGKDRERAAEHPGCPAPPGSEDRERQAKQAGDRDGAAAREQPLGDVIAVEAAAQLARILREGAADLLPGGVVDRGRFHDRPEPGERDRGRHRKGDNPGQGRRKLPPDE